MSDKLKIKLVEDHVVLPFKNPKQKLNELHFVQLAMKNLILVSDENIDLYFAPVFNALRTERHAAKISKIIADRNLGFQNINANMANYDRKTQDHTPDEDGK